MPALCGGPVVAVPGSWLAATAGPPLHRCLLRLTSPATIPILPTLPALPLLQVFWEKQLDTKCCVGWNEDTVGQLLLQGLAHLPAAVHCCTCAAPARQHAISVPLQWTGLNCEWTLVMPSRWSSPSVARPV